MYVGYRKYRELGLNRDEDPKKQAARLKELSCVFLSNHNRIHLDKVITNSRMPFSKNAHYLISLSMSNNLYKPKSKRYLIK